MKIFRMICSVLVMFTTALFIVTAAQNLTLRSADVYLFYFNDSGAAGRIYTSLSNAEMADAIAENMNSLKAEEFQVYEDTGYDLQGIFTEEESATLIKVKKKLDADLVICLISLLLSVAIFAFLLRSGYQKVLRKRVYFSIGLSCVLIVGLFAFMATHSGRIWLANRWDILIPESATTLTVLLGSDFISMANNFFIIFAIIFQTVVAYMQLRLTRPSRIFY